MGMTIEMYGLTHGDDRGSQSDFRNPRFLDFTSMAGARHAALGF